MEQTLVDSREVEAVTNLRAAKVRLETAQRSMSEFIEARHSGRIFLLKDVQQQPVLELEVQLAGRNFQHALVAWNQIKSQNKR